VRWLLAGGLPGGAAELTVASNRLSYIYRLEGPRRPTGGEQSQLSLQLGVLSMLRAELAVVILHGWTVSKLKRCWSSVASSGSRWSLAWDRSKSHVTTKRKIAL
jgi:hypothetical protein